MLRQAARKAPRKTARKSIKRAAVKKTAATKGALTTITPAFEPRIKTFVNNLGSFIAQRKTSFSASDPIYKRLNKVHSALERELRKNNILNAETAKHLKSLTPALRGVANLPASIKGQVGKLAIFVRGQVNKDVQAFIKNFKAQLAPIQVELNNANRKFAEMVKKAAKQKIQWKVSPAVKAKFNAVNAHYNRYRKKWLNRLNKVNLHANAQVKNQVKSLKKQLEEIQKGFKKCQTVINRYAKTPKVRKGFKTQEIVSTLHVQGLESKIKNIDTACEKVCKNVENFKDHLRAIKLF